MNSLFPPDTLFTAFIATVEKIITYALGEHDPGSAHNWRTSNELCSPGTRQQLIDFFCYNLLFRRPFSATFKAVLIAANITEALQTKCETCFGGPGKILLAL